MPHMALHWRAATGAARVGTVVIAGHDGLSRGIVSNWSRMDETCFIVIMNIRGGMCYVSPNVGQRDRLAEAGLVFFRSRVRRSVIEIGKSHVVARALGGARL